MVSALQNSKQVCQLCISGLSEFLVGIITFPGLLKSLSEGELVAGITRYFYILEIELGIFLRFLSTTFDNTLLGLLQLQNVYHLSVL